MTWQEALEEIQTHEFDVNLNVVSSYGAFFKAASRQPAVQEMARQLAECSNRREETLGLIYDISNLAIDPRYENPKDTSLAILLWLTSFADPEYSRLAAFYVDQAPQCWYAKKLARSILTPAAVKSSNASFRDSPKGNSTFSSATDSIIAMASGNPKHGISRWKGNTSADSGTYMQTVGAQL